MAYEKKVADLIAGGLDGADLGAALSKKSKKTMVSAVLGAAVKATYEASQRAKEKNFPIVFEQDGKLMKRFPDGRLKFVKDLPSAGVNYSKEFTLE